ncbi:hypothetical protein ILYODFUR_026066 [Ilyodon furcidens]|uniref:Uncharacterized protein n=1 Tax=Ilyodon furcidens TaxID=33524 RepID=A0ABV0V668_9TELE
MWCYNPNQFKPAAPNTLQQVLSVGDPRWCQDVKKDRWDEDWVTWVDRSKEKTMEKMSQEAFNAVSAGQNQTDSSKEVIQSQRSTPSYNPSSKADLSSNINN